MSWPVDVVLTWGVGRRMDHNRAGNRICSTMNKGDFSTMGRFSANNDIYWAGDKYGDCDDRYCDIGWRTMSDGLRADLGRSYRR